MITKKGYGIFFSCFDKGILEISWDKTGNNICSILEFQNFVYSNRNDIS